MKLRLFKEADAELKQFDKFELASLFYQLHPAGTYADSKCGSMVPFGLRVLDAELSLFMGRAEECIGKLRHLQTVVVRVMQQLLPVNCEESRAIWQRRLDKVKQSMSNVLVNIRVNKHTKNTHSRNVLPFLINNPNNPTKMHCVVLFSRTTKRVSRF